MTYLTLRSDLPLSSQLLEAQASTSSFADYSTAVNSAVNSEITSSLNNTAFQQNPPASSREKIKNNILANYIDPDLQFTLDGLEEGQMNKLQGVKRTQKPLSWYLMEDKEDSQSPSPALSENRKSSVDSLASSINSMKMISPDNKDEKKKGKKGARQRVKKVSVNFTIAGSETKDRVTGTSVEEKTPTSQLIAAAVAKDRKEDYWYYDPISDGFYYENNGSRGWKKVRISFCISYVI